MYGGGRKGRQTDGHVFRPFGVWGTVADPLAFGRDDGLAGGDVQRSGMSFDAQGAFENQRVFVKLRSLAWFDPAMGTLHVGDAQGRGG